MREQYIRTDFDIEIRKEDVFYVIECNADSPVYDLVEEEWEERKDEFLSLVDPRAILVVDTCEKDYGRQDLKESQEVFYVLESVGDGLEQLSTRMFQEGDALAAMLADAAADAALESLTKQVEAWLQDICKEKKIGILRRLEAPGQIPMEAQKYILEKVDPDEQYGITVSSGYMFRPVKSMGHILITTQDTDVFRVTHNCRTCDRKDCRMRSIKPVTVRLVKHGETKEQMVSTKEESILELLSQSSTAYSFPCGGRGVCGKCKIQVLEGEINISKEDKAFFTEEELRQGYRLACRAFPTEDVVIAFAGEEDEDFEVLGEEVVSRTEERTDHAGQKKYNIAIDIGTTTLAVSLVEKESGQTIQVHTAMNRQRKYGADVISRIQASCDGKGEELQQTIRQDLMESIRRVLADAGVEKEQVQAVAIAGNTTMGHLLMGLSCKTLGVYPFTPVDISMREFEFEQMFGTKELSSPVLMLPGISTYVGADITAGMLHCGFADREKICVLVDLGTNGEMAIGNKERILVTSTAAGPAFEGGNISCGVGSVAGAVSDITIKGTDVTVQTIGDKAPVGVCGTGAIAAVAELLENEWVDETGLLDDAYFDDGFLLAEDADGKPLTFTQKDVREMQLAIAAVRAGLETLLLRYEVTYEEVDKLYLAGGFGYKMNLKKAVKTGLLPEQLSEKVETVGNSSLAGAKEAAANEEARKKLEHLCSISTEISLSTDQDFNELYMEHMMFE